MDATITLASNAYQVNIGFTAQGNTQNYETVEITGLVLMGEWSADLADRIHTIQSIFDIDNQINIEEELESVIKYTFSTPFIVNSGASINISIPISGN